ncbi:hypothetical protein LPJ78_005820 [Coemansia sp. RSA 989]|nr:hypothetical protein BX667DRAFT_502450 [Coemansia mojavensis]KAJ1738094.1 hypothetical protein LPJ68_005837 [Coemansia sp. RSA 1086]KAJ1746491.1 hypothetical protein LPJ79_005844 [Coemansia sp. RSA 1821]KAJ1860481.1 hypothetical protein LPJ78_005820 [Coemansia sp. RSA 989]KAJ1868651.1 hypothetical protein LPJ55_005849 [Coemansia sp. RSA 990]KAJ2645716.1 hypothetical protein IWW40_005898 [Coemansia sp. RSA 1250]KAJ2667536.1 hypothetical protein IWW42_005843 [Coemansia sp. RSA 1085]
MFNINLIRPFTQRAFFNAGPVAAISRRLVSSGSKNGTGPAATGSIHPQTDDFARSLTSHLVDGGPRMVGRSVPVISGHVGRAYARLNRIIANNRVREELFRRKRYEKPKYKRQRLRQEGHARRFKAEVRKKVHLIWKMKTLGI